MSAPLQPADLTAYLATPGDVERELLRLFRPQEPLVIFDIGACEGEDSVRYSRQFPAAQVYAFEPLPTNQSLVRANFARYDVRRAELVPLALADRAGEATFHVSSGRPPEEFAGQEWNYGNKSSSLLPPASAEPMHGWIKFTEAITVRTESLDNFCHDRGIERIDIIHMDVQGAEHLVLAGAVAMLPHISAIWLEVSEQEFYAGQKLRGEIQEIMRAHGFHIGYEVRRIVEGDQLYLNTRHSRNWRYLATYRLVKGLDSAWRALGRAWTRITG